MHVINKLWLYLVNTNDNFLFYNTFYVSVFIRVLFFGINQIFD
jgi:hypothetical protein